MSIDLDVIAGVHKSIRWGELKSLIHRTVSCQEARDIVGIDPGLFELQSNRAVAESEELSCPGYYYFEFAKHSTLSLTLEPNPGGQEDVDYIDDFARNLGSELKETIRRTWEAAGFLVTVTSNGGRAEGELKLLVQIAGCIAKMTKGYVVVTDNGFFHQPIGIFAPDEFTPGA